MMRYLRQGWLVMALSLAFGGALAGVHLGLTDRIEANKKQEILQRIPQLVMGFDHVDGVARPMPERDIVEVVKDGKVISSFMVSRPKILPLPGGGKYMVYRVDDIGDPAEPLDDVPAGMVARIKGQGFADAIELLVGLTYDGAMIMGIYVLDQKETPGVGNKIELRKWNSQFDYQPNRKLTVIKDPSVRTMEEKDGRIDAVSGATVSSKAVCSIVNKARVALSRDWSSRKLTGFEFVAKEEK